MTLVQFPQNTTTECFFLYAKNTNDDSAFINIDTINLTSENLSDMVNCSFDANTNRIIVTDPTQNCSFTIEAWSWAWH